MACQQVHIRLAVNICCFGSFFLKIQMNSKFDDTWSIVSIKKSTPALSMKASRQSTLGYTHDSSLSVDGAQATNLMVMQDTDKVFF